MTKRVKEEEKSTQKENHEIFLTLVPGTAIMDSGCRTAVAGENWHQEFQRLLTQKGLSWYEEEEEERFQFGAGGPEDKHKAFIY